MSTTDRNSEEVLTPSGKFEIESSFPVDLCIKSTAFTVNDNVVTVGEGCLVKIYTIDGELVSSWKTNAEISSVACSGDEIYIASDRVSYFFPQINIYHSNGKKIRFISLAGWAFQKEWFLDLFKGSRGYGFHLTVDRNNTSYLSSVRSDNIYKLEDKGENLSVYGSHDAELKPRHICTAPNGNIIAESSKQVVELKEGSLVDKKSYKEASAIKDICSDDSGSIYVTDKEGMIHILDENLEKEDILQSSAFVVMIPRSIAVTPNGQKIAVSHAGSKISVLKKK